MPCFACQKVPTLGNSPDFKHNSGCPTLSTSRIQRFAVQLFSSAYEQHLKHQLEGFPTGVQIVAVVLRPAFREQSLYFLFWVIQTSPFESCSKHF